MYREDFVNLRHDLRTFLNHIVGYSQILQEDALEYGRHEFIQQLKHIKGMSEELKQLVNSFFTFDEHRAESIQPEEIKRQLYNPLFEIVGKSRELQKNFLDYEAAFLQEDIKKILKIVNRMLDIIDERVTDLSIEKKTKSNKNFPILPTLPENKLGDSDSEIEKPKYAGLILIVDESDIHRDMLTRHLERQGHTILTAKNGFEALDILDEKSVDIIILDIMMSGMNGYQLLRSLKRSKELRDISVIMISALEETDSVAKCIELGAEDYLSKDFDPILLRARIDASLEKKRLREQEQVYLQTILESQRILSNELADAAAYIKNLLPRPMNNTIKTNWLFIPSAQLGGDCFGYHWLDNKNFAMYLLDVSGHGIGAALLSVSVVHLLRNQALPDTNFLDPAKVLESLNSTFNMDNQNNMFFTIWYGVYNTETKKLTYADGGAPPAILIQEDISNKSVHELKTKDIIIGLGGTYKYQKKEIHITPHSKIFLFSDGAYEMRKTDGTILGYDKLLRILSTQDTSQNSNLNSILNQIQGLTMSDTFEDDLSLIEVTFPA